MNISKFSPSVQKQLKEKLLRENAQVQRRQQRVQAQIEQQSAKLFADPPKNWQEFENFCIDRAHEFGWTVAHFRPVTFTDKSGEKRAKTGVGADGKGFPDLVLAKPYIGVMFWELKTGQGALKPDQVMWRDVLIAARQEWYEIRPEDGEKMLALLNR